MKANNPHISRRRFLRTTGAASAAMLLGWLNTSATAGQNKRKPNFVFIFADDLGWGDLGCYGNREIKTPNLDKMAKKGALFTQFYVAGSVCSPSRAGIMTSHFPARHGVHGHFAGHENNKKRAMPNWLDPKAHTVTRLLKNAGYTTGHFGKWHLGGGKGAPEANEYGVDEYRVICGKGPGYQEYSKQPYFWAKTTELFVDDTIKFIEKNKDKPFYVNLWTLIPHATLHPTEEQMKPYKRYAPKGVPYHGTKKVYYASVTNLDTEIGRVFDKLKELGLMENTCVIFSSDNGPEDLDIGNAVHSGIGHTGPFRGRKRSLYEGGVRLPFIVQWDGKIPAGHIDNGTIVGGVDFLPTVCSLAGVKLPGDLNSDGEDMSAALLGKSIQRKKPLMWEWRYKVFGWWTNKCPSLAIREGKWKLLMNPDRSRVELYDIPNDPTEVDSLAKQYPEVVERLSKKVLAWQKTLPPGPCDNTVGSNKYPWPGREK
ncbi:MAG: sulfatase-like hydrolase/transferase [Planctomycetota bacterium]|jgi:N-acetylgalactosamine-6-sulfatase